MTSPHPRTFTAALAALSLLWGLACKRPETALRERPVQKIELVQAVEGMTPLEEKAVVAQLCEGLGVPADPPETAGPTRVFRLTLRGRPNASAGWGLGTTLLVSTGTGVLAGALLPVAGFTLWTTWRSAALAAGAGGLLGLAYGPAWFRHNQTLLSEKGYLPWGFSADWEVLERRPRFGEEVVARSGTPVLFFGRPTPILDLKPHLKALPAETRTEADVRQASLRAYVDALVQHVKRQG